MCRVLYYSEFYFHVKWFCIISTGNVNTYLTESYLDDLFTFPLKISPINPAGLTCVMMLSCFLHNDDKPFQTCGRGVFIVLLLQCRKLQC